MNTSDINQQRIELLQKYPLEGHCKGRFGLSSVSADFIETLLPKDNGLVLAPQKYTPEGEHPLLLMFNNTWLKSNPNLEKIAEQKNISLNLKYFEFIVMIPYVQFSDARYNDKGPYCFLPVLYLDSWLAVWGGRIFWEFNKELADFSVQADDFAIKESNGDALLTAKTGIMERRTAQGTLDNFEAIKPILQLPVIEYGDYGFVSSIYKILLDEADIFPAGQQFTNASCSFLPSEQTINSPSIEENPLGAFYINYKWKLSYIDIVKF